MEIYVDNLCINIGLDSTIGDIYEKLIEQSEYHKAMFLYMFKIKHNEVFYENQEQKIKDTDICLGDQLFLYQHMSETNYNEYLLIKNKFIFFDEITEQTPDICLEAVKQDGLVLDKIKEKTHEICLAAVDNNGLALKFVEEQTEEICLVAVKNNHLAYDYVKNKNIEICCSHFNSQFEDDDSFDPHSYDSY